MIVDTHSVQPEHRKPSGLGLLSTSLLAGTVGAVAGTVAVVLSASITWKVVQSGLWMLLAPGIAGTASIVCQRMSSANKSAISGCIGGVIGGLCGAFFAILCAEAYSGRDWTISGGLCGVAAGGASGATLGVLAALIGIAVGRWQQARENEKIFRQ